VLHADWQLLMRALFLPVAPAPIKAKKKRNCTIL
jgi:hypothetical protein